LLSEKAKKGTFEKLGGGGTYPQWTTPSYATETVYIQLHCISSNKLYRGMDVNEKGPDFRKAVSTMCPLVKNFTQQDWYSKLGQTWTALGVCMYLYTISIQNYGFVFQPQIKADFQSSHEAPRSSLRVHAWALSSNHNAKQLILIGCKHSQRAAKSFVRGLEIRLKYMSSLENIP
jgi:hypothetical protein